MPPAPSREAGTGPQRRARLVCHRCHGKKIKCDLAQQAHPGSAPCRNCSLAKATCQIRPSKRGARQRQPQFDQNICPPVSFEDEPLDGITVRIGQGNLDHSADTADNYDMPTYYPTTTSPHAVQNTLENTTSAELSQEPQSVPHSIVTPPSSVPTNSNHALPSQHRTNQPTAFGDSGFMPLFSRDNVVDEDQVQPGSFPADTANADAISAALQGVFLETYLGYCFVWCPVLDDSFVQSPHKMVESPLLLQAVALCANRIQPPLIWQRDSYVHYNRAKELFYGGHESSPLIRIASIMLFFWWSTGAPNLLNMDNAWWWTGIAIRIAQESGLNRELQHQHVTRPGEAGLRRRIWWTLFARDRILSISQGRPTIIDPDYMDVRMVTPKDFPASAGPKAQVFINWIRLMEISGRVSKVLSKRPEDRTGTVGFLKELTSWIQSLPQGLTLDIRSDRTVAFDRDVHRLHLTYLTHVALLHLSKSSQSLPRASSAAIIAASCVARLLEDYLARGNIRFLTGDAGWEIAVCMLALLHARRIDGFTPHADADILTLRTALHQMELMWPSSRMFAAAFDRLLGLDYTSISLAPNAPIGAGLRFEEGQDLLDANGNAGNWMDYFPFVSSQTSPLIDAVLDRNQAMRFSGLDWPTDINATLQELLSLDGQPTDLFNL